MGLLRIAQQQQKLEKMLGPRALAIGRMQQAGAIARTCQAQNQVLRLGTLALVRQPGNTVKPSQPQLQISRCSSSKFKDFSPLSIAVRDQESNTFGQDRLNEVILGFLSFFAVFGIILRLWNPTGTFNRKWEWRTT